MKIRALLEARNEANNIILSSDKFLKQNESILTEEEIETTKNLVDALRKSVAGEDKDLINKVMQDLNDYSSPLAHRAMDFNIGQAIKGTVV